MVVCFVVFDDVCRADGVEDVGQSEMVGTGAVKSEKLFVGLAMGCTCVKPLVWRVCQGLRVCVSLPG